MDLFKSTARRYVEKDAVVYYHLCIQYVRYYIWFEQYRFNRLVDWIYASFGYGKPTPYKCDDGGTLSVLSNIFNNHPALMVGTMTLMNMDLDLLSLKVAYLANVIGSDIGSLLLPMGTLATLMWMHIVRKGNVKITWWQYIKVTIVVIPPTLLFTLVLLYYWVTWLF